MNPFRARTTQEVATEEPNYTERDYNTILTSINPWKVEVVCRYCGEKEVDTVNTTADRAIWLTWLHQRFVHNRQEKRPTSQLIQKRVPEDVREVIKAQITDDLERARLAKQEISDD